MRAIAELCKRPGSDVSAALAAFRCSGIFFDDDDKPPDSIFPPANDRHPQIAEGSAIINGVALPQNVIDQLRQLGIAISWYTQGELEEAVEACAVDGILIDDDEGVDFRDKLRRTEKEAEEEREEREANRYRLNILHVRPWETASEARQRERTNKEREKQRSLKPDQDNHEESRSYSSV